MDTNPSSLANWYIQLTLNSKQGSSFITSLLALLIKEQNLSPLGTYILIYTHYNDTTLQLVSQLIKQQSPLPLYNAIPYILELPSETSEKHLHLLQHILKTQPTIHHDKNMLDQTTQQKIKTFLSNHITYKKELKEKLNSVYPTLNPYRLSKNTFVEETESLKQGAAGAGLTDND